MSQPTSDIAARIAQRALAERSAGYTDEVRRLLDAALAVMRERGTGARPRVADIVTAAGLSNEAFYRHFRSKDALVAALLEDGAQRLHGYVAHQMAKETQPRHQVHRWVEGVLSQAAQDSAATTRAVLWNAGTLNQDMAPSASGRLAGLLPDPFRALGSADPEFDASLAAHAVFGALADHLWRREVPSPADVRRTTAFCLRALTRPEPPDP
ncbi:MAG TPA: helix-turn-helix domain-containing protein [Pseudonocardiaceae bacterium]|jgi:AcrR family transcriptional regulator|nr:helix-turn-helix domain-containing protein [Pseudonocardiaceae bacterium]